MMKDVHTIYQFFVDKSFINVIIILFWKLYQVKYDVFLYFLVFSVEKSFIYLIKKEIGMVFRLCLFTNQYNQAKVRNYAHEHRSL